MQVADPIPKGTNIGPDGKTYPFGWLGAETAIGEYIVVEVLDDRDDDEPKHYVIYGPATYTTLRRRTHVWKTMAEALIAVSCEMIGVNPNTSAQVIPVVVEGLRASVRDNS